MAEVARSHLCKLELRNDDNTWRVDQPGVGLLYPGKWLARMREGGKTGRLTITHADGHQEVLTDGMSCSCHPVQAADLGIAATPAEVLCSLCGDIHPGPDGSCLL